MERLDLAELFADTGEFDGLAGHRAHRQGRTAAGIAVQLGEDDAVDLQLLIECLGDINGLLTDHRVDDQQDLLRLDGVLDANQLVHQHFVDLQTAGGIDDQHVAAQVAGTLDGFLRGLNGILGAVLVNRHLHLLTDHLQLLDSGGAVDVTGGEHGLLALLDQPTGQLGGHGGLTGALQTAEHVDRQRAGGPGQLGVLAAHKLGHLIADDGNDLLGSRQAGSDLLTDAALGYLLDEILGDGVVDVGLKQRHANLTHALLDALLRQLALAAQLAQCALQLLCQALKGHCFPPDRAG